MLEGVKAPGCHRCVRWDVLNRHLLQPDLIHLATKGRNYRVGHRPSSRLAPDQPGAPGAEYPLVATGDEEVAAEVGHAHVLDPEPVYSIDAQYRPIFGRPAFVDLTKSLGHVTNGQL